MAGAPWRRLRGEDLLGHDPYRCWMDDRLSPRGCHLLASTNYEGHDLLYCWSTSTLFESERGYGKFAAYAVLNHAGDFIKAAAALAKEGFGTPATDAVPAFPLECLPTAFRALVEEGSTS